MYYNNDWLRKCDLRNPGRIERINRSLYNISLKFGTESGKAHATSDLQIDIPAEELRVLSLLRSRLLT